MGFVCLAGLFVYIVGFGCWFGCFLFCRFCVGFVWVWFGFVGCSGGIGFLVILILGFWLLWGFVLCLVVGCCDLFVGVFV